MTGWDMEKRGEEKRWEKRKRKKEEKRWEERGKREREKDGKERKRKKEREGWGRRDGSMEKEGREVEKGGKRREVWWGAERLGSACLDRDVATVWPSYALLPLLYSFFKSHSFCAEFSRSLFLKSQNVCYLKIFEWNLCQGHGTLYCGSHITYLFLVKWPL